MGAVQRLAQSCLKIGGSVLVVSFRQLLEEKGFVPSGPGLISGFSSGAILLFGFEKEEVQLNLLFPLAPERVDARMFTVCSVMNFGLRGARCFPFTRINEKGEEEFFIRVAGDFKLNERSPVEEVFNRTIGQATWLESKIIKVLVGFDMLPQEHLQFMSFPNLNPFSGDAFLFDPLDFKEPEFYKRRTRITSNVLDWVRENELEVLSVDEMTIIFGLASNTEMSILRILPGSNLMTIASGFSVQNLGETTEVDAYIQSVLLTMNGPGVVEIHPSEDQTGYYVSAVRGAAEEGFSVAEAIDSHFREMQKITDKLILRQSA